MLAFMRKLFKEELIHPNVVGSKGANEKDLFGAGRSPSTADGTRRLEGTAPAAHRKNPDFALGAFPLFAHDGGTPIMYHNNAAGIFTFVKKGLAEGEDRGDPLHPQLVAPRRTAPRSTSSPTSASRASTSPRRQRHPAAHRPGRKEVAYTYVFLGGRPLVRDWPYPEAVKANIDWQNASFKYIEKTPFDGIRIQRPSKYVAACRCRPRTSSPTSCAAAGRSATPSRSSTEWRRDGGDEARELLHEGPAGQRPCLSTARGRGPAGDPASPGRRRHLPGCR